MTKSKQLPLATQGVLVRGVEALVAAVAFLPSVALLVEPDLFPRHCYQEEEVVLPYCSLVKVVELISVAEFELMSDLFALPVQLSTVDNTAASRPVVDMESLQPSVVAVV